MATKEKETPTGEKEQQGRGGGDRGATAARPTLTRDWGGPQVRDPAPIVSVNPSLFCFFSISLFSLHLLVALRLRSLRFHSPRLCRAAVFLIQTNVSLYRQTTRLSQIKLRCADVIDASDTLPVESWNHSTAAMDGPMEATFGSAH